MCKLLQFLGDFILRPPTGALTWNPLGSTQAPWAIAPNENSWQRQSATDFNSCNTIIYTVEATVFESPLPEWYRHYYRNTGIWSHKETY